MMAEAFRYGKDQLDLALERARRRVPSGIGTQSERLVHTTLKYLLEPDDSCHEIPIGHFVADIFQKETGHIYEIQTSHFGNLRDKLEAFLPEYTVTVVYPVAHRKTLYWVHPDTGEVTGGRKSPRVGSAAEILSEIYRLPAVQNHPNLDFLAVLLDLSEYRSLDGWSRDHKKGSHRLERVPVSVDSLVYLKEPQDYLALIPDEVKDPFTKKQICQRMHLGNGMKSDQSLAALIRSGAIRRAGRQGKAYLYERQIYHKDLKEEP